MESSHSVRWLRWALNCTKWSPTKTQWLKANGCIQGEELQRIEKFVFQQPAISSMVSLTDETYAVLIYLVMYALVL